MVKNKFFAFFFIVLFLFLCFFSFFSHFGDEQENLVAGWLILQGLIPYRDFFFHHAPLPFFISALGELLWPENGIYMLRLFLVAGHLLSWFLALKFSHKSLRPAIYLSAVLISVFLSPILHLHMILADSLIVLALNVLIWSMISWIKFNIPSTTTILKIFIIAFFVSFWSSIASILPFGVLGLAFLFYLIKKEEFPSLLFQKWKILLIGIFLNLVFPIYFLLNNSLNDFIWSVYTYNQKYYFPHRLASGELEEKLGIGFQILNQFMIVFFKHLEVFINSTKIFLTALLHSPKVFLQEECGANLFCHLENLLNYKIVIFDQYWSHIGNIESVIFLSFLSICVILILKKKKEVIFLIAFFISLRFRSNEIFHQAPFFTGIAIFLSYLFFHFAKKKSFFVVPIAICIFVLIASSAPKLFELTTRKNPPITLLEMEVGKVISQNSKSDEKLQVIAGDTIYYYTSQRLPANKFFYYLPWFKPSEKMYLQIRRSLENSIPKIIYFDQDGIADYREELYPLAKQHYFQSQQNGNVWLKQ